MLTLIGSLAARFVGLVPWAGPRTTQALLYVLLAVIVIGGPAGATYIHMRAKMGAAEETLNAKWRATLAEAEKEYVEMANAAILAATEVDVVPADSYQLDELCQRTSTCRDSGGPKR